MRNIISILFLLQLAVTSNAQECFTQTPAQTAVIHKAVTALKQQFAKLQSLGWIVTNEKTGENSPIAKSPAPFRPMMLCDRLYKLALHLDPASARAKMLQDSINYYTAQSQKGAIGDKAWINATKNMARLMEMQQIQIMVTENTPYLVYGEPKGPADKNIVLHVNGASFAYLQYVAPADDNSMAEETTWLYIGNWTGIKELKNNYGYVAYPFIHKQLSPFIETLELSIKAPAQVANTVINKIDWAALNDALTK